MRIAILALHFAEYASRLAVPLAREHKVRLILNAANARDELSPDMLERLRREVDLQLVEVPRFRDPRVFLAIAHVRHLISDHEPDIVHIQEFHQAFTTPPILSMRRRVPVIMTVHDALPHSGASNLRGWRWAVVQWVRRQCSRMIVHGSRNRRDLVENIDGIDGRVDVVPHGMLGRDTIDHSLEVEEPGTFLFFGRIERYKGLEYLLQAQSLLRQRGRASRVVVAGRGTDLDRHRDAISRAPDIELSDRFIPSDELPALFHRALAVVLPYTDATQSGISAMAFAHSRPVIATNVGDVPEVVVDGESGLIVEPRDAVALANAMERLLDDRALRDKLAVGAACMARDALSWERIATETERVYKRAIRQYAAA